MASSIQVDAAERRNPASSAVARRHLLQGAAAAGLGALGATTSDAVARGGPERERHADLEFLDYEPPRGWAAAARVGDIVYLAGETARDAAGEPVLGTVAEQAEIVYENIGRTLRHFRTDFAHVFKITVYLRSWDDIGAVSGVAARYLSRPVPSTAVVVSRLSEEGFRVEVDATALIPRRRHDWS